ncbi:MAG: hypothetical protein NWT00_03110, partial [Beijerinckiaceae bacterium]|nr:hypothetical protein [Beijerinckiaceae bacterium]
MTLQQQFDPADHPVSAAASGAVKKRRRLQRVALSQKTPAGIQRTHVLARRRFVFASLNVSTYCGLLIWLGAILRTGGWSGIDIAIFVCFAAAAPWGVLGIWNALIGLWLLHRNQTGRRNWLTQVAPYAAAGDIPSPIHSRTAVLMTICNEKPERALARLAIIRDSLERTSAPDTYDYFVLSDTRDPAIASAEEAVFARWQ